MNKIIIGLDENNKSSFYGSYIFSGFIINEHVHKVIKNNSLIRDSKKSTLDDMNSVYNFIRKELSEFSFVYEMCSNFINKIIIKNKINQNYLTMIGHLMLLKNILNKYQLDGDAIVIIDDFMNTKKQKYVFLKECLKIMKSNNIINEKEHNKIIKIVDKIKFIPNSESKYRCVAVASQIGYIQYINHFKLISSKYNINYEFLIKNKNNYKVFFDYWMNRDDDFLFLTEQVRWTYPKATYKKMIHEFDKIKSNIPSDTLKKIYSILDLI